MVPEGWKLSTFESHIDCLTGYAFKSSGYVNSDNGVKLLRGDNISPNGLRWREAKHWPEEGAEDLAKFQLHPGDFVIALDRTWISSGIKVAEVTPDDLPCLLVQRVARLRAKSSLEQGLLRHYFSGHRFTEYVKRSQTMTAVPHISPTDLKEFTFLLPTKPEQKKISEILYTWDRAIATTEQLLANSQQQKKALMQHLLTGNKRLRGFSGDFKRHHFDELLDIDSKSLNSRTPENLEFNYISLSDVEPATVSSNLKRYQYKDAPSRARRVVKENDILLSTVRPNLKGFAKIEAQHDEYVASTGFAVLTPRDGTCGDYIFHYLFSAHISGQINALVVGTNYPAINSSDVAGLCVYCPPYQEQVLIADILTKCDKTINTLKSKINALKQEKKALMQQLLTGKRRVKVDEEAAA